MQDRKPIKYLRDLEEEYAILLKQILSDISVDSHLKRFVELREYEHLASYTLKNATFRMLENLLIQDRLSKLGIIKGIYFCDNDKNIAETTRCMFIELKEFLRKYPTSTLSTKHHHEVLQGLKDDEILRDYFDFLSDIPEKVLFTKDSAHDVADFIESEIELKQEVLTERESYFTRNSGTILGSTSMTYGGAWAGFGIGLIPAAILFIPSGGLSLLIPLVASCLFAFAGGLTGYLIGSYADEKKREQLTPTFVDPPSFTGGALHYLYKKGLKGDLKQDPVKKIKYINTKNKDFNYTVEPEIKALNEAREVPMSLHAEERIENKQSKPMKR